MTILHHQANPNLRRVFEAHPQQTYRVDHVQSPVTGRHEEATAQDQITLQKNFAATSKVPSEILIAMRLDADMPGVNDGLDLHPADEFRERQLLVKAGAPVTSATVFTAEMVERILGETDSLKKVHAVLTSDELQKVRTPLVERMHKLYAQVEQFADAAEKDLLQRAMSAVEPTAFMNIVELILPRIRPKAA
jgi:hypothetical protein